MISNNKFRKAKKAFLIIVSDYAEESMKLARANVLGNTIVCGDGRYPLRSNSWHCSFDVIDIKTKKVLAIGIVDKPSSFHPGETFERASNLLETEAMKRAIQQLSDIKNKRIGFVIDGDNKNRSLLEQQEFKLQMYRYPNHLISN